jgi:hypothetical protein
MAECRRNLDDAIALLPTPEAKLAHSGPDYARMGRPDSGGHDLTTTVWMLLPTPRATDGEKGGPNQRGSSGDLMLPSAVMSLGAPPADAPSTSTTPEGSAPEAAEAPAPTPNSGAPPKTTVLPPAEDRSCPDSSQPNRAGPGTARPSDGGSGSSDDPHQPRLF